MLGSAGSWLGDTTDWGNGTLWTVGEIIEEIVKLTLLGGERKEACVSVRAVDMPCEDGGGLWSSPSRPFETPARRINQFHDAEACIGGQYGQHVSSQSQRAIPLGWLLDPAARRWRRPVVAFHLRSTLASGMTAFEGSSCSEEECNPTSQSFTANKQAEPRHL